MSRLYHYTLRGDVGGVLAEVGSGAPVDAREDGMAPLHWALARGHADVALVLLEHGADPRARALSGWEPIHLATAFGLLPVIERLALLGVDMNAAGPGRATPWDVSIEQEQPAARGLLVKLGASYEATLFCHMVRAEEARPEGPIRRSLRRAIGAAQRLWRSR